MRNFTKCFLILIIGLLTFQANGQNRRYLDPVFDDVEVSGFQFAGTNFTILGWIFAASQGLEGHTIRQPLAFQTYTPVGDSETGRPLVIFLHTGNFFPFPLNGSCGGTVSDSSNVEIATRLAQMGYVVASADYRLGWLPTHPQELVRRFSLINGAYRGVQDVNTFIKFFKKSVEELGNPYGIDPNKIVVWGQGTGGYLSLATAYLNDYSEILTTSDPNKFLLPTANGPIPMVIEKYNGNIAGDSLTIVDPIYNAISQIPIGDTLAVPNHVGYDTEFQLAVNMGGALGDSTWVSEGEVPLVSFHSKSDLFANYKTGILLVPTAEGPQPVVEVSGSYDVQRVVARVGLNDIFSTIPEGHDPIGDAKNDDFNGLCLFANTPNDTGAPWEWTDLDNEELIATDCNGEASVAKTYIDSIMAYYAPRGCVALDLNCDFVSATNDTKLDASYLSIAPNPAQDYITVSSTRSDINTVIFYGMDGKVITELTDLQTRSVTIERNDLPRGIYFVKASFDEGVITQKVMFD